MLKNEAMWIRHVLGRIPAQSLSPCLNLGSSTRTFRETVQPHIESEVFKPLRERGVEVIHSDLKDEDGVDIVGDILETQTQRRLLSIAPRSIICCNILEHLYQPQEFADACLHLIRPGGYILVSVPRSFPFHSDPIDTYFRPTPAQLGALFRGCENVESAIVNGETYLDTLKSLDAAALTRTLASITVHSIIPFYRWNSWKNKMHSLLWLFRHYQVSVALLKAP